MNSTLNFLPAPTATSGSINADASTPAKKRPIGARSIAQSAIFSFDNGEDSRALKPSYRAPLPGAVKTEAEEKAEETGHTVSLGCSQLFLFVFHKILCSQQQTNTLQRMGISPEPAIFRKMMDRIYFEAEHCRKPRKQKDNPDESDSDMSNIEDNPAASNFPHYGHPRPGQWIDDYAVMNYPTPPTEPKRSAIRGTDDEVLRGNARYGGYPAPLAVPMNFFCDPRTPHISKIDRSRLNPTFLAKPGPPREDDSDEGPSVEDPNPFAKRPRVTCSSPPRKKRKYTWKAGVAPKRRLGHVKNGEQDVEINKEVDWDDEKEWADDESIESVLLDDETEEEEEEESEEEEEEDEDEDADVEMGEGGGEAPIF